MKCTISLIVGGALEMQLLLLLFQIFRSLYSILLDMLVVKTLH